MIDTKNSKRNLVIPKWLEFSKASKSLSLSIPRKNPFIISKKTKKKLYNDYTEFKKFPSAHVATDLMGSAIVIDKIELAKEIAKYVIKCKNLKKPTLDLAYKILNPNDKNKKVNLELEIQIAEIKKKINKYPKNAIYWIDIGRLYTIKGQWNQAEKAIVIALNLSPTDRYIVRCGVRFFLHIKKYDFAWFYLNKATSNSSDPWLKATELNVSFLVKKKIKNLKRLNTNLISYDKLFHYSELIESFGMLEVFSGNNKKAKNNFKLAWSNPSENVITHGEWVIRNLFPNLLQSSNLNFEESLEAQSWRQYFELNLSKAIQYVKEWELEEPYSTNPFLLGSSIAISADNPIESINFINRGLDSNPDDFLLLNNKCFALIKAGKINDAQKLSNKYPKYLENDNKVFFLATKGLLEFKKGNINQGRELYQESIQLCKKNNYTKLYVKAYLNLALAEAESVTKKSKETIEIALKLSKNINEPDIFFIRKKIKKLFKKL
ncbi:MAG: hypothetical protein KAW92_10235 [Candidatus Cloacimonetes bacterium]|nr:hypothetical protein [Candidatus Cloacimonadota bacterium]